MAGEKGLDNLNDQMRLDEIIVATLKDESFRRKLRENPRQALDGARIPFDDKQIDALKKLDWDSIESVFAAFNDPRGNFT